MIVPCKNIMIDTALKEMCPRTQQAGDFVLGYRNIWTSEYMNDYNDSSAGSHLGIDFMEGGYYNTSGKFVEDNKYMVPYAIYGVR